MNLLDWNHKKVRNLSPLELWLFILGRVLVGFGMGALAVQLFPSWVDWLTFPPFILGAVLLIFALKGLLRKSDPN